MQRNRHAALLKAAGYEDAPALTVSSIDGDVPHGRELNFTWLAGTIMTGLTSVLLMGGALYVSFQGQDTFSTAVEALPIESHVETGATSLVEKTDRVKPIVLTRSEREIVDAPIREKVDGRVLIRQQPFSRLRATLATAGTALTDNIPPYDPVALLNASQPVKPADATPVSTDIYGADVQGEVALSSQPLSMADVPKDAMSDARAADFARQAMEGVFGESSDGAYLAYASADTSIHDLGVVTGTDLSGIVENVTVVQKSDSKPGNGIGRTERIVTLKKTEPLADVLTRNGFTSAMIDAISTTMRNVFPQKDLPVGARLRILLGPSRISDTVIPYRLSIYINDIHAATVALTDHGRYVLATRPPDIVFPKEDTEEVNVNNLPSIYRSLWETGRKHGLPDNMIERIISMYAYDLDLNKPIDVGDSIEMLETVPDQAGKQDLLYVGLQIGNTKREFFRFRADDGSIDFYDPDGQTGRRFLTRRPLEGGGRIASRFGYRKHPVLGTYKLHTGVDLAADYGTPIYASGDGVVERAQWESGYGRFVMLKHANGYETGYGHMSRIAPGMAPGVRVRQGQIIGYVGSTGISTGNHLHFEIRINGRFVDPLSVKLPRDKSLPPNYQRSFETTVAQIRDLMQRAPAPIATAAIDAAATNG